MDAKFIDHEKRKVLAVEMSCPWTENREKKQEERTIKYGPLRWELKQHFPGYDIRQYNMIIDVLRGWSPEVDEAMKERGWHSRLVRDLRARGPEFDSRISHPCFDFFPF